MPLGPNEVRIASPTANKMMIMMMMMMMSDKHLFTRNDISPFIYLFFLPLAAVMFDMRTSMGLSLS